jgi:hypothetical protein
VAERESPGVLGDKPIDANTRDDYRWRLTRHLLPFFASYRLDKIDRELCSAFKAHKLQEAQELRAALAAGADLRDRQGRTLRPLGPASIRNMIDTLAAILDDTIEDQFIDANPARGKRMRIRVPKPNRTFLEMDELVAVINEELVSRIVGFYYHDFDDHEADFVPSFLVNDILRFWRTLTLNYEHDRYEIRQLDQAKQARARAKSSLKNYKLKLSRLATSFSMVVHLASESPPVGIDPVVALTALTPQQRFEALRGRNADADGLLDELGRQYARFRDQVQQPEAELLKLFADRDQRRVYLAEAAEYGATICRPLALLVSDDRMRQLVA